MSPPAALALKGVSRSYTQAGAPLTILRGVDFSIHAGQSVARVAASGTGKSTLLHIAGLLEKPDAGEVTIGGTGTVALADAARTALRRTAVGFVYQFHHLLPEFSALENVVMPQMIAGLTKAEARRRARALLDYLGLGAPRRAARRRADRQPRPQDRRPRLRRAQHARAGDRARRPRRDPQHGPRRPYGPPGDAARRHGGGARLG